MTIVTNTSICVWVCLSFVSLKLIKSRFLNWFPVSIQSRVFIWESTKHELVSFVLLLQCDFYHSILSRLTFEDSVENRSGHESVFKILKENSLTNTTRYFLNLSQNTNTSYIRNSLIRTHLISLFHALTMVGGDPWTLSHFSVLSLSLLPTSDYNTNPCTHTQVTQITATRKTLINHRP